MRRRAAAWAACLLAAALLGLGLGAGGHAIAAEQPAFAWPTLERGEFLALGALLGVGWSLATALVWRASFGWEAAWGLKIGAWSLGPALLGWAGAWVGRVRLPAPHDFALRSLEIFSAAQGLSMLALALAPGLVRLYRDPALDRLSPRALAWRLGGLALLTYSLIGAWTWRWHMTGDGPHYVLMAESLAKDGDVNLKNNYAQGSWRAYHRFPALPPQMPDQPDGRQVPEHKPGFSAALLPGLLMGIEGARLQLAAYAALGASCLFLLCLRLGFSRRQALLAWALLALASPWLQHSSVFLAELLPGLLLLAVLCAWQGLVPLAWAGPAMALLPWMHVRYFPVLPVLAWLDAWVRKQSGRRRLASALWLLLGLGSALLYNRIQFGSISVTHTYEQRNVGLSTLVKVWEIPRYVGGLLIDQEYGWLPYAPVYGLAFFGLWSWWRRDRRLFWLTVLPSLAYLGPISVFPWWFSGMMPNRYVVPLTPFFALWTIEAWRAWGERRSFMALAWISWSWSLVLSVLPWFSWGRENGHNWILKFLGTPFNVDLCPYFPSFFMGTSISYLWLAAVMIGAAAWARRLGPPNAR